MVSRAIPLPDEAATARLGAALEALLAPGDAVLLSGPLGAGKSTLARALIRAATTPDEPVPSPTFTLVQTYEGRRFPIAHFDLYRLADGSEVEELGLYDALEVGAALIEWPDRLPSVPPDRIEIELEMSGDSRLARLTGHGVWSSRLSALALEQNMKRKGAKDAKGG